MIKIITIILISTLYCINIFSQNEESVSNAEIFIHNRTNETLYLKFYPVGGIYTHEKFIENKYFYNPRSHITDGSRRKVTINPRNKFCIGLDRYALDDIDHVFLLNPNTVAEIGHDWSSSDLLDGIFYFGKYMLEIYRYDDIYLTLICSIPIDWLDFNYTQTYSGDLAILINSFNQYDITYYWFANFLPREEITLFDPPTNGHIEVYRQYYIDEGIVKCFYNPPNKQKNVYSFKFNSNSDYLNWPHVYNDNNRNLLKEGADIYTIYDHLNPEKIEVWLNIQGNPSPHIVNLISGKTLSIEDCAKLILESGSILNFESNSTLLVKGQLINNGGSYDGSINIRYKRKYLGGCNYTPDYVQNHTFPDGSTITFEDSASTELDSGSTMILQGPNSKLIMNPNSAIYFGKDSKLILRDGARLIANNATFTYLDSTNKIWDGIYLEDLSNDTIINCIIENAINGINIINKTFVSENPNYSTQITGCTFRNTTSSTTLNYGINIENSDNILIKDCDFYGSTSAVFSNAVNMSYCPDRNVNIIGNEINNSVNGIFSTGSSPYIAFNTFNGSAAGYGIYMDNSNGKIKYNNITGYGR